MCNCHKEIAKNMEGKKYNGQTVRKVTFLNPRIRMRFEESSKSIDIGAQPNSCPFCGKQQPETENPQPATGKLKRALNSTQTLSNKTINLLCTPIGNPCEVDYVHQNIVKLKKEFNKI